MITLEKTNYGGWPNCLRLTDGRTEIIVTTDVGPRIIRYGFVDGANMFKEFEQELGCRGGSQWRCFGGHRLWLAPEDRKRTYVPDNNPVPWKWNGRTLALRQPPDPLTSIRKELRIQFTPKGALRVHHRLVNTGKDMIHVAPWALTVMAPGGEAIFPQEPFAPHPKALLPVRPLVLWAYTRMDDSRWTWGEREIRLRQDTRKSTPQKVGFRSSLGWMAYVLKRHAFIKRHTIDLEATYPDLGCNVETFTNREMLELETLGPLMHLMPTKHTDHEEVWTLDLVPLRPSIDKLALLAAFEGWRLRNRS